MRIGDCRDCHEFPAPFAGNSLAVPSVPGSVPRRNPGTDPRAQRAPPTRRKKRALGQAGLSQPPPSGLQYKLTPMKRLLVVLAAGAAALVLASCKHSPPADVAAEVNGHAITMAELDKTYQSNAQQAEGASEDQIMAQKIDLLSSMIIQEIMLQRAEKLGLAAVDADVDGEISKMRALDTKEEFDKKLAAQHMTLADLKTKVRSKLTVDKLVNKEITSKITITDADISDRKSTRLNSSHL